MKYSILVILTISLLTGCGLGKKNDFELTVTFYNADGLTTSSPVKLNGVVIGQVKSIELNPDNKVNVNISLDKIHEFPSDSKALLVRDLLGGSSINIRPGLSLETLKDGQQIEGQEQKIEFDKEVNINNAMDLVGELLDPNRKTTQDSILLELRRLNKNVEKLLEKR